MKRVFLIIVVLLSRELLYAQSVKEIEDSIVHYLDKLQKHSNYLGDAEPDSLDKYNTELQNFLQISLTRQPLSLYAKFSGSITKGMKIASSEDKKFRIYSWDTQNGGTMHGFNSVAQFQTRKGAQTEVLYNDTFINGEWSGPGFFYPKIYEIHSSDKKIYYLAIRDGMYSTKNVSTGIKAFAIENNRLNDSIKIFKTTKNTLNSIDCEYDYFSNYNEKSMKENHLIHLSKDKQILYIPIIDGEKMTEKYLVYKFDGTDYVFDKNGQ